MDQALCNRLGAFQHLEREKAVLELSALVQEGANAWISLLAPTSQCAKTVDWADAFHEKWPEFRRHIEALEQSEAWESKLGALLGAKVRDFHVCAVWTVEQDEQSRAVPGASCVREEVVMFMRVWSVLRRVQIFVPVVDDAEYDASTEKFALDLLSHKEVRVRNAVADTLGVLAKKHGAAVWERCKDVVLSTITANFVRLPPSHDSG
jgi:hypothetical protein